MSSNTVRITTITLLCCAMLSTLACSRPAATPEVKYVGTIKILSAVTDGVRAVMSQSEDGGLTLGGLDAAPGKTFLLATFEFEPMPVLPPLPAKLVESSKGHVKLTREGIEAFHNEQQKLRSDFAKELEPRDKAIADLIPSLTDSSGRSYAPITMPNCAYDVVNVKGSADLYQRDGVTFEVPVESTGFVLNVKGYAPAKVDVATKSRR